MNEVIVLYYRLQNLGINIYLRNRPQNGNNLFRNPYFKYERHNDPIDLIKKNISEQLFNRIFRIPKEMFLELLDAVTQSEQARKAAHIKEGRPTISLSIKLGCFLVYVGRDPNYLNCGLIFGISEQSAKQANNRIAEVLFRHYESLMKLPRTYDELNDKKMEFNQVGLFSHCVGAIDGCHFPIGITNAIDTTSLYNHKGFYSLNSIVVVDAKCCFMGAELGLPGCRHDSHWMHNSFISTWLQSLPSGYFIVGDNGFTLTSKLLIPYDSGQLIYNASGRSPYNYWLSVARVRSEMAFGLLKRKFAFLRFPSMINKSTHVFLTKVCMLLHNLYFRKYCPSTIDMEWEQLDNEMTLRDRFWIDLTDSANVNVIDIEMYTDDRDKAKLFRRMDTRYIFELNQSSST